jgi:hypothetical protein
MDNHDMKYYLLLIDMQLGIAKVCTYQADNVNCSEQKGSSIEADDNFLLVERQPIHFHTSAHSGNSLEALQVVVVVVVIF